MNTKTRERAIRLIISSFLQSNLTAKEISDISSALTNDADFMQDLGKALFYVSNVIYDANSNQKKQNSNFEINYIDDALYIINNNGITKKEIIYILGNINRDFIESRGSISRISQLTLKELLYEFFAVSNSYKIAEFMNIISSRENISDKYLEGLLDR